MDISKGIFLTVDIAKGLRLTANNPMTIVVIDGVSKDILWLTFEEYTLLRDNKILPQIKFRLREGLQEVCHGSIEWNSWDDDGVGEAWFTIDCWPNVNEDIVGFLKLIHQWSKESFPSVRVQLKRS